MTAGESPGTFQANEEQEAKRFLLFVSSGVYPLYQSF